MILFQIWKKFEGKQIKKKKCIDKPFKHCQKKKLPLTIWTSQRRYAMPTSTHPENNCYSRINECMLAPPYLHKETFYISTSYHLSHRRQQALDKKIFSDRYLQKKKIERNYLINISNWYNHLPKANKTPLKHATTNHVQSISKILHGYAVNTIRIFLREKKNS